MNFKILTREQFNSFSLKRDNYKCVICLEPATEVHHIIERKLFPAESSGYFLDNAASLCQNCHLKAEATEISCSLLRDKIGIKKFPLPEHFDYDTDYDKWGNPILSNGMRLKGEMFYQSNVQKIIQPFLHLFLDRTKYPRTYHFSWSEGATSDDKVLDDISSFYNMKSVVVTEKFDGECTSIYKDYLHARSIDYSPHPSRTWIKSFHAQICNDIPEGWRICGENLYAKHSIKYSNLETYFFVFSIWNDKNECLSWKDTIEWCNLIGLKTVPVMYEGPFDPILIKDLYKPIIAGNECEGYVVRNSDSFSYSSFRKNVAKFVRKSHVKTTEHWMHSKLEINGLK